MFNYFPHKPLDNAIIIDADKINCPLIYTNVIDPISPVTTVIIAGIDIKALENNLDGFPTELKNLSTDEIKQLENIDSTTISATQWGFLGNLASNPVDTTTNQTVGGTKTFSSTSIFSSGLDTDTISPISPATTVTIAGVDVVALYNNVGGFPQELKNLTTAEIQQLENIGTDTISAAQWGYLGAQDQEVATTDNVTFNSLTLPNGIYLRTSGNGYAFTDSSGNNLISFDAAGRAYFQGGEFYFGNGSNIQLVSNSSTQLQLY